MHNYAKVSSERKLESCSNRRGRGRRACVLLLSTSLLLCTLQEGKALKAQTTNLISDNMGDGLVAKEKVELAKLKEYEKLKKFLNNDSMKSVEFTVRSTKKDIIGWILEVNKAIEGKKPEIDSKALDTGKTEKDRKTSENLIVYKFTLTRQLDTEKTSAEVAVSTKTAAVPGDLAIVKEKEVVAKEPELPNENMTMNEFTNWFYIVLDISQAKGIYETKLISYERALRLLNTIRTVFSDSPSNEDKYVNETAGMQFSIERGLAGAKLIIKFIEK